MSARSDGRIEATAAFRANSTATPTAIAAFSRLWVSIGSACSSIATRACDREAATKVRTSGLPEKVEGGSFVTEPR